MRAHLNFPNLAALGFGISSLGNAVYEDETDHRIILPGSFSWLPDVYATLGFVMSALCLAAIFTGKSRLGLLLVSGYFMMAAAVSAFHAENTSLHRIADLFIYVGLSVASGACWLATRGAKQ
ncbi:hypothetical protein [Streptomyces sp. CBMA152]|uniref:hypothetical protein n=1 Tax=Streptomyces sp. CBMA152 TaxID=1896312 RepID=UPI0016618883|nr:hypothetical protein [Streptomyces sp. CBMA152]MBD0743022.1 hypothetical protein [Streptomyces sp. CBMA152]